MTWKASCAMDERVKFVGAVLAKEGSTAFLCRKFGVSRKTGYKWLERYATDGVAGLEEHSRAPKHHPQLVAGEVVEMILACKRAHLLEGPKKILVRLARDHPHRVWPAASTVGDVLRAHGLVQARKRRLRASPTSHVLTPGTEANCVWSADFKGYFHTGDGRKCTPLTIADSYSRFFLLCQGLGGQTSFAQVRPLFELAFRQFGLPVRLRTDNGSPFASVGLGGLSPLAVWCMRLGIVVERIRPGHPEENGRLERLHRTLKQATATPPAANLRAQQRSFNAFLQEYNEQRPHEALGQLPPASFYVPSPRSFPDRLPALPSYPQGWEVRMVRPGGWIKWTGSRPYLAEALAGERVGFEPVGDGRWKLYFMRTPLAFLDERTKSLIPLEQPKKRRPQEQKAKEEASKISLA